MTLRKLFCVLLLAICAQATSDLPPVSPQLEAALNEQAKKIQRWGRDPVIVKAVQEQNSKHMTQEQINQIDKAWMANLPAAGAIVREILARPCSEHLRELTKGDLYAEAFAMDDMGANVCMAARTSDYWQGDEDKWQKSYNGSKGAVFIDRPQFDDSAKIVEVQISVPVIQPDNKVIGALTVGVIVNSLATEIKHQGSEKGNKPPK
jgi:hypothetical protein